MSYTLNNYFKCVFDEKFKNSPLKLINILELFKTVWGNNINLKHRQF